MAEKLDPTQEDNAANGLVRGPSLLTPAEGFGWKDPAVELHLGPSLKLSSSTTLAWKNIAIERYLVEPGEKSEVATSSHILSLACGQQMTHGERTVRGRLIPYSKAPGTIHLFSDRLIPTVYPSTQTELIIAALDPAFVAEVVAEQESGLTHDLRGRMGFRDEALGSLIRLLEAEANSGGLLGRLYVDHLTYALTLRVLFLGMKTQNGLATQNTLSHRRLERVVERMEADLSTDLDLKTLAAESGYSRNHFLRMFRAATGYTPHQYLLRLRVKRAQAMMKNKSMRLVDVALACGFSSHAQLSRVFRQLTGATPTEYRRNIS